MREAGEDVWSTFLPVPNNALSILKPHQCISYDSGYDCIDGRLFAFVSHLAECKTQSLPKLDVPPVGNRK
jgi:hypothetical protein